MNPMPSRAAGATPFDTNVRELVEAIDRARRAITSETAELTANQLVDCTRHRQKKDLCLLDLMRRARVLDPHDPGDDARAALRLLREAIIENQRILRVHLAAVREVAKVILDVIVDENSDRTYARTSHRRTSPG